MQSLAYLYIRWLASRSEDRMRICVSCLYETYMVEHCCILKVIGDYWPESVSLTVALLCTKLCCVQQNFQQTKERRKVRRQRPSTFLDESLREGRKERHHNLQWSCWWAGVRTVRLTERPLRLCKCLVLLDNCKSSVAVSRRLCSQMRNCVMWNIEGSVHKGSISRNPNFSGNEFLCFASFTS